MEQHFPQGAPLACLETWVLHRKEGSKPQHNPAQPCWSDTAWTAFPGMQPFLLILPVFLNSFLVSQLLGDPLGYFSARSMHFQLCCRH